LHQSAGALGRVASIDAPPSARHGLPSNSVRGLRPALQQVLKGAAPLHLPSPSPCMRLSMPTPHPRTRSCLAYEWAALAAASRCPVAHLEQHGQQRGVPVVGNKGHVLPGAKGQRARRLDGGLAGAGPRAGSRRRGGAVGCRPGTRRAARARLSAAHWHQVGCHQHMHVAPKKLAAGIALLGVGLNRGPGRARRAPCRTAQSACGCRGSQRPTWRRTAWHRSCPTPWQGTWGVARGGVGTGWAGGGEMQGRPRGAAAVKSATCLTASQTTFPSPSPSPRPGRPSLFPHPPSPRCPS
jgi:hypothetical protein